MRGRGDGGEAIAAGQQLPSQREEGRVPGARGIRLRPARGTPAPQLDVTVGRARSFHCILPLGTVRRLAPPPAMERGGVAAVPPLFPLTTASATSSRGPSGAAASAYTAARFTLLYMSDIPVKRAPASLLPKGRQHRRQEHFHEHHRDTNFATAGAAEAQRLAPIFR